MRKCSAGGCGQSSKGVPGGSNAEGRGLAPPYSISQGLLAGSQATSASLPNHRAARCGRGQGSGAASGEAEQGGRAAGASCRPQPGSCCRAPRSPPAHSPCTGPAPAHPSRARRSPQSRCRAPRCGPPAGRARGGGGGGAGEEGGPGAAGCPAGEGGCGMHSAATPVWPQPSPPAPAPPAQPTCTAKSPRMVPDSASSGLVAPISLRALFTTPAPSHTCAGQRRFIRVGDTWRDTLAETRGRPDP